MRACLFVGRFTWVWEKKHHRVQTTLKTMLALNENEMIHIKICYNASSHPEALTSKIIVQSN